MAEKKREKLKSILNKRKSHWYQYKDGELEHTFNCIEALRNSDWARDLVAKTEASIELMQWFDDNRNHVDTPDWLLNWDKFEELRTSFFEVRYGVDVHIAGYSPTYESNTLVGASSVDFMIAVNGFQFLIELVSTRQSESMSEQTEYVTEIAKMVATNAAEELRKIQGKIVRKVAKKIGEDAYQPHKFPEAAADSNHFNIIVADTRGFAGGDHLSCAERFQLVWGSQELMKQGGSDWDNYGLFGLFDQNKPGAEAKLFRERIHLLGLVSEEYFGAGEVMKQIRFYGNRFLRTSTEAFAQFPLKNKGQPLLCRSQNT